jgi:hypothetical protein
LMPPPRTRMLAPYILQDAPIHPLRCYLTPCRLHSLPCQA